MYDHDLTREEIIDILDTCGISQNSKNLSDYEFAKTKLSDDWNDFVAREVANYVGV